MAAPSDLMRQPSLSLVGTSIPGLEAPHHTAGVHAAGDAAAASGGCPAGVPANAQPPVSPWLTRLFARQPASAAARDALARM